MAGLRPRFEERDSWEDADGMRLERGGLTRPLPLDAACGDSIDRLTHAIEDEIIPRLVLARRGLPQPGADALAGEPAPASADVAEFARLVRDHDVAVAKAYVESLRARGATLEAIYLDLLAPTARLLGDLWVEDLCDFTEVTIGLWRLHQVVRELSPAHRVDGRPGEARRRALLVALPGEQHTFGVVLLAEFFRHAGWDVWSGPIASSEELRGLVESESFGVVGLSVSCGNHLQGLASEIHGLRRASRNRGVGVMVGGPVFTDHPELVALVGADATAVDARHAAAQADSLLAVMAGRF